MLKASLLGWHLFVDPGVFVFVLGVEDTASSSRGFVPLAHTALDTLKERTGVSIDVGGRFLHPDVSVSLDGAKIFLDLVAPLGKVGLVLCHGFLVLRVCVYPV